MEGARPISHEVDGEWTYDFDTLEEAKAALLKENDGIGGYITESRVVFTLEQ
jgi:hypothetical protein